MNIDRKIVREQFASYTRNYDPEDPKIALKITHTYKVAENCEEIAKSIGLSQEEIDFCWLSGMLHDVGRFEQVKRYNTFIDSKSVDHAEFGADLLFGSDRLIETYTDDRSLDHALEIVIRQHNKFRIAETVSGQTLTFCNILRDADKIDIFRVNIETPMEDIYNVSTQELADSEVTPEVMEYIRNHIAIDRKMLKTPADHHIGHLALAFELVYPKSYELVKEQGYLYQLFDFKTNKESTKKAIEETSQEIEKLFNR